MSSKKILAASMAAVLAASSMAIVSTVASAAGAETAVTMTDLSVGDGKAVSAAASDSDLATTKLSEDKTVIEVTPKTGKIADSKANIDGQAFTETVTLNAASFGLTYASETTAPTIKNVEGLSFSEAKNVAINAAWDGNAAAGNEITVPIPMNTGKFEEKTVKVTITTNGGTDKTATIVVKNVGTVANVDVKARSKSNAVESVVYDDATATITATIADGTTNKDLYDAKIFFLSGSAKVNGTELALTKADQTDGNTTVIGTANEFGYSEGDQTFYLQFNKDTDAYFKKVTVKFVKAGDVTSEPDTSDTSSDTPVTSDTSDTSSDAPVTSDTPATSDDSSTVNPGETDGNNSGSNGSDNKPTGIALAIAPAALACAFVAVAAVKSKKKDD